MHPLTRLVVAGPIVAPLVAASLPGRAGEFAPTAPVPGMALTQPDPGMANGAPAPVLPAQPAPVAAAPAPGPVQADPTGGRRRPPGLGSGFSSLEGRLPNQRTGLRHPHVVRDICIGC
ncbi:hypothetical protein [Methylobacterium fujisawaense]|uniref:hypothetical protein n=1 Tax=Methylobacterium fujisawaense TaxID=107400 RepID=UPI0036F7A8EA